MPVDDKPDYHCAECHIFVSPDERKAGADGKVYHKHHHPDAKKRRAQQLVLRFTGEGPKKVIIH